MPYAPGRRPVGVTERSRSAAPWFAAGALAATIVLPVAAHVRAASPGVAATLEVDGTVMSGGRPLGDASVRLVNGSEAGVTVLATTTADSAGRFSIAGPRPAAGVVYVEAAPPSSTPSAVRLRLLAIVAAASGPAATRPAPAPVVIDELTTVASAFAMAQFQDASGFSGPSPGLDNSAAAFFNLVDPGSGEAGGAVVDADNGASNATLATLNTLANLLAACANPATPDCATLLAEATPPGSAAPSDTAIAAGNLARHPTLGVQPLWELARRSAVYAPALDAAPTAWILVLLFTDQDLFASGRIALDGQGNAWSSTNWVPGTQDPSTTISVLDPAGQPTFGSPISGAGMRAGAWGIAVATDGAVWAGSFGGDAISQYAADGTPVSPSTGWTQGALSHPQGMAVDQRGNLWIANNYGPESAPGVGSVVVYPGGDPSKAFTITGGGLNHPFAVQIDGAGRAWVTNAGPGGASLVGTRAAILVGKFAGSVTVIGPDFQPTAFSPIEDASFKWPLGLSMDAAGAAWVANYFGSTVTRVASDGTVTGVYELPEGTLPWSEAVDGSGRVWVAGFARPGVWLLCGSTPDACPPGSAVGTMLSPADGFQSEAFQHFTSIQLDASGNVWLSNNWSNLVPPAGGTGIAQIVGAATPVCTPLGPIPVRPTGATSCAAGWVSDAPASDTAPSNGPTGWLALLAAMIGLAVGLIFLVAERPAIGSRDRPRTP